MLRTLSKSVSGMPCPTTDTKPMSRLARRSSAAKLPAVASRTGITGSEGLFVHDSGFADAVVDAAILGIAVDQEN